MTITGNSTDIIPSVSVAALVQARDAIVERFDKIRSLIAEQHALAKATIGEGVHAADLELPGDRRSIADDWTLARAVASVDCQFWAHLLDQSGLRSFLDQKAREEWRRAIEKREVVAFTSENIHATFAHLYADRDAMFERGVVEVFAKLSRDYKTNNPRMFGKRIVLSYAIDRWGTGKQRYTSGITHTGSDRLDDLVRVLSILDGRPEPDHRQGVYHQLSELQWMRGGGPTVADLEFFQIKGCLNGNAHVTFKRPDLIEKMNQILVRACPNALPPE